MNSSPVQKARPSLAGTLYFELRQALVDGKYAPAQRLSEPELALQFKTSRSPVREALHRLEQEGFVERAINGRISVKSLDFENLAQLYVLRATVEGLAARLAAPLLRTLDLESMSKKLDEMERAVKRGNAAAAIERGQEFHDIIIRECGNEPLRETLDGLNAKISRYRSVVASLGNYDPNRVAEHRRILSAFYSRNAELAEAEMTKHVNRSAEVLVQRLRKRTLGK